MKAECGLAVATQPCILPLARLRVVVQSNTNGASMMAAVLADDIASAELPQASVVITRDCYKICTVCGEGTVPDPALVIGERSLQEQCVVDWIHRRPVGG